MPLHYRYSASLTTENNIQITLGLPNGKACQTITSVGLKLKNQDIKPRS